MAGQWGIDCAMQISGHSKKIWEGREDYLLLDIFSFGLHKENINSDPWELPFVL